jgi:internalin A
MTKEAQNAYQIALRRIEACLRKGDQGTYIELSGLGLTQVPPQIGQLSSLKEIYLADNKLTSLPPEIGNLIFLERLILENNALCSLPESLKKLTNLVELTLHGNEMLGLPVEVLGPTWGQSSDENTPAEAQEILDYYFRSQVAGGPLNEVRLILVGRGGAGKFFG